jgi:hypothetical protein
MLSAFATVGPPTESTKTIAAAVSQDTDEHRISFPQTTPSIGLKPA